MNKIHFQPPSQTHQGLVCRKIWELEFVEFFFKKKINEVWNQTRQTNKATCSSLGTEDIYCGGRWGGWQMDIMAKQCHYFRGGGGDYNFINSWAQFSWGFLADNFAKQIFGNRNLLTGRNCTNRWKCFLIENVSKYLVREKKCRQPVETYIYIYTCTVHHGQFWLVTSKNDKENGLLSRIFLRFMLMLKEGGLRVYSTWSYDVHCACSYPSWMDHGRICTGNSMRYSRYIF